MYIDSQLARCVEMRVSRYVHVVCAREQTLSRRQNLPMPHVHAHACMHMSAHTHTGRTCRYPFLNPRTTRRPMSMSMFAHTCPFARHRIRMIRPGGTVAIRENLEFESFRSRSPKGGRWLLGESGAARHRRLHIGDRERRGGERE